MSVAGLFLKRGETVINEKMAGLGKKRSVIREIFEYAKLRRAEIGEENVFDFSIAKAHEFGLKIFQNISGCLNSLKNLS